MRAFHAGQQRSDCSATTGALDWSRRTTCAARPSRHAARAPDGIVDSPCVPHASQEQQSSSKSRAMAADGTLLSAHRPCTSHSPRAHGCTLATRSHTRIHCMRRAAACRGESLTDRPRVCACATPGRPFWSCTLPSHPNPSCMQKERHQSVKVRPSAAMARATSLSPACARVPSERLRVGPRVRLTIAGTSGHALMTWRSGRLRATTLSSLLCASLVACGQTATVSVLCRAVPLAGVCRSVCGRGAGRHNGQGGSPRPKYALPSWSLSMIWA